MTLRVLLLLLTVVVTTAQTEAPWLMSGSPLRRGLAAYWRLEESSGTRYDSSKNGNALTSNNSVGQGTGIQQNCATFVASSSQTLSAPASNTLTNSTAITWTCWVKLLTASANFVMMAMDDAGTHRVNSLFYNSGTVRFAFYGGNYANPVTSLFGFPATNTWYFIAAGYDLTNLWIKVNNSAKDTMTNSAAHFSIPFTLGGCANGGGLYFNGSIDEAGVWNRTLTTNEITFLYNSGKGTHFPWAHP